MSRGRRVSPLYMKRLLAAGFDRVYEIARSFRDEPVDATHSPEESLVEAYAAYADYITMRGLVRDLSCGGALTVLGTTRVPAARGPEVDLADEWPVRNLQEAVGDATGEDLGPDLDRTQLVNIGLAQGLQIDPSWSAGQLLVRLHEELVERQTEAPTLYTDFPLSVSPLARQHRDLPRLAERWDLVIFGREVAAAYTELVDPDELRHRLEGASGKV